MMDAYFETGVGNAAICLELKGPSHIQLTIADKVTEDFLCATMTLDIAELLANVMHNMATSQE
ncbi:hypothetical protein P7G87_00610 [Enterococcus asini]|uniref:hypothetical protein n=1 Tax=Enterococcus asini TaxID=57732 RepID=UPI00288FE613|nr:hypothetical protein [Enterococcus asini]MDT2783189.1 hypothetical protein [Enterococcus asini]